MTEQSPTAYVSPMTTLRLSKAERVGVRYVAFVVAVFWAVWFGTEWPHPHFWWLWGTLIAVAAWVALSVAMVGQWRVDADIERRRRERKLQTHAECPTCNGTGWVRRD